MKFMFSIFCSYARSCGCEPFLLRVTEILQRPKKEMVKGLELVTHVWSMTIKNARGLVTTVAIVN